MKKARFVAVAAVAVATAVGGVAPVVAADPADYPMTLFPSGAASPFSITRGPDGALWFTFSNGTEFGNAIGRIDTAGDVTRFELPNPGSQPGYITTGPDGAL
jgi:streptogramin lyase